MPDMTENRNNPAPRTPRPIEELQVFGLAPVAMGPLAAAVLAELRRILRKGDAPGEIPGTGGGFMLVAEGAQGPSNMIEGNAVVHLGSSEPGLWDFFFEDLSAILPIRIFSGPSALSADQTSKITAKDCFRPALGIPFPGEGGPEISEDHITVLLPDGSAIIARGWTTGEGSGRQALGISVFPLPLRVNSEFQAHFPSNVFASDISDWTWAPAARTLTERAGRVFLKYADLPTPDAEAAPFSAFLPWKSWKDEDADQIALRLCDVRDMLRSEGHDVQTLILNARTPRGRADVAALFGPATTDPSIRRAALGRAIDLFFSGAWEQKLFTGWQIASAPGGEDIKIGGTAPDGTKMEGVFTVPRYLPLPATVSSLDIDRPAVDLTRDPSEKAAVLGRIWSAPCPAHFTALEPLSFPHPEM